MNPPSPSFFILLYATMSTVTLLLYFVDKNAAIHGRWRIPERTLHLMALLGGWPGAWLGQKLFHHKSKKKSFLFWFWISVLLNCTGLIWSILKWTQTRS